MKQQTFSLSQVRRSEVHIKVLAGLVLGTLRGVYCVLSSSFWCCWQCSHHWLLDTSLQPLFHLHLAFSSKCLSLCVPISSSYKDTSRWAGACSNPLYPHLSLITSAKTSVYIPHSTSLRQECHLCLQSAWLCSEGVAAGEAGSCCLADSSLGGRGGPFHPEHLRP